MRPCLILTATAEIATTDSIVVAAITGTPDHPSAPRFVAIPWAREGFVCTGLRKASFVACDWIEIVSKEAIVEKRGYLPLAKLEQVLSQLTP